jgi:hypothetical protein
MSEVGTMTRLREGTVRALATTAIAVSVLALTATLTAVVFPWTARPFRSSAGSAASYVTGQRIDVPRDLYDNRDATLLLFARSSCRACEDAKPAFAALTAEAATKHLQVRLVLQAEGGSEATDSRLVAGLGLSSDQVRHLEFEGLQLERVPAVAVVIRDGTIVSFVEGIPDEKGLDSLLDGIRDVATSSRVAQR